MATQRKSLFTGSLVGLAGLVLGTAVGCGSAELPGAAGPDPVKPPEPVTPGKPPTPRVQPPAVSGGTLLVLKDGTTAVAADPDRDVIWIADLKKLTPSGRVDLQSGDEPGRLVEDRAGKVHVALRRGGALLTIDPVTSQIITRRAACAAPRGVAYDAASDRLHVACAGGELVTFAASGGAALRTVQLDNDLRDVIVKGSELLVSRFRSAELLTIDASGTITGRSKPKAVRSRQGNVPTGDPMNTGLAAPAVAWRIHPLSDGKVAMLFERAAPDMVDTTRPGGYGNGQCKGTGIVGTAITILGPGGEEVPGPTLPFVPYAVDFAVTADSSEFSLISPLTTLGSVANPTSAAVILPRAQLTPSDPCDVFPSTLPLPGMATPNEAVAGAYDGTRRLVVQLRNPARLLVGNGQIDFAGASDVTNDGHRLFHAATASAIACASCHPEGGDDGRVWNFRPIGARRTQDLRGGILATAPFHWDGDMTSMQHLMETVFVGRMGGVTPAAKQVDAIASWLDAQPSLPKSAPADPQAVARGKLLFDSAAVGCASCHSGSHFTNNTTVAVGTGKAFQVPALIDVASRAPYMHTGCAATLAARFDPTCGGGDSHGKTSQLSPGQLADLVSYLATL